jgi:hypothetical protein
VEKDVLQADQNLQSGLEAAASAQEQALDVIEVYTQGNGTTEEEQAKAVVIAIKATADAQMAEAAFSAEQTRLHADHRAAMVKVDELHLRPRAIAGPHAADQAEDANHERHHSSAGQSREPEERHGRVR